MISNEEVMNLITACLLCVLFLILSETLKLFTKRDLTDLFIDIIYVILVVLLAIAVYFGEVRQ